MYNRYIFIYIYIVIYICVCVGYMVFTEKVEFLQTAHFSNSYRFVFCRGSTANVDGTHGNTRMDGM